MQIMQHSLMIMCIFLWLHFGFSCTTYIFIGTFLTGLQIRDSILTSITWPPLSLTDHLLKCILYISLVLESFPIQLPIHCFSIFYYHPHFIL